MGWIVKSESDIERVWVEVDDQLREIPGRARVEMFDRAPLPTPTIITRVEPWYRRPAPFSALVAAATTCTIEALLHILSHVL